MGDGTVVLGLMEGVGRSCAKHLSHCGSLKIDSVGSLTGLLSEVRHSFRTKVGHRVRGPMLPLRCRAARRVRCERETDREVAEEQHLRVHLSEAP